MITISIQNAIAIVMASMSLGITISEAVQFFIITIDLMRGKNK